MNKWFVPTNFCWPLFVDSSKGMFVLRDATWYQLWLMIKVQRNAVCYSHRGQQLFCNLPSVSMVGTHSQKKIVFLFIWKELCIHGSQKDQMYKKRIMMCTRAAASDRMEGTSSTDGKSIRTATLSCFIFYRLGSAVRITALHHLIHCAIASLSFS